MLKSPLRGSDDEASVTIGGDTTSYATLEEAVNAAKAATGDVVITILKDDISFNTRLDFTNEGNILPNLGTVTIQSSAGNMFTLMSEYGSNNSNIRAFNLVLKDIILDGNGRRSATTIGRW